MASYHQFISEERSVLAAYLKEDMSLRTIAEKLMRPVSSISYEITHNSRDGTRIGYDPHYADVQAALRKWDANSKNPRKEERVYTYITEKLLLDWSPEQIAGRMQLEFPRDITMRISHETIYQFVNSPQGREFNLILHLRRGTPRRLRPQHRTQADPKIQKIPNRTPISERPQVVETKSRFGDWESDSMVGRQIKGAVLSVQRERKCFYMRIRKAKDKSAISTTHAVIHNLKLFPRSLRRTMTFDNGSENVQHEQIAARLTMQTYFCNAYHSWEKGGVENSIGLIRQYLPKSTSLDDVPATYIKAIERRLNSRPRKSLYYKTPHEVLSAHLLRQGVRLPT